MMNDFKNLLAKSESFDNPKTAINEQYFAITKASNGLEYLGKYQFGQARMLDISRYLKINVPSKEMFLNNPDLQEKFFDVHLKLIEAEIKSRGLNKFIGKDITGKRNNIKTQVSNWGLIAGIHLGGATGLNNLLVKGIDKNDDYYKNGKLIKGNFISDYVAKFSDVEKKKIKVCQSCLRPL
jgi:hypothetical protein